MTPGNSRAERRRAAREARKPPGVLVVPKGMPVIPLRRPREGGSSPGKMPRFADWQSKASADPHQTQRWADRYGALTNWGGLTGIDRGDGQAYYVVDVDPRLGGSLAAARDLGLRTNYVTDSGGGGRHLTGLGSPGLATTIVGPGITILGLGSFAVLPESEHRTGRRYRLASIGTALPFPPAVWTSKDGASSGPIPKAIPISLDDRRIPRWLAEMWPLDGDCPQGSHRRGNSHDRSLHETDLAYALGRRSSITEEQFVHLLGLGPKGSSRSDESYVADKLSKFRHARQAARGALNLPPDFWNARGYLVQIRQAAWSRTLSPDGVLGVVLARASAAMPPTLRLPPVRAEPSPLNIFAALSSPSGGGKTGAVGVGKALLPAAHVREILPSSGEGLIEAFFETEGAGKDRHKVQRWQNGLGVLDEGLVLGACDARSGSTLLPNLRSMWSGTTAGQDNASEDRKRRLAAGAYTFGAMVLFQEGAAGPLLSEAQVRAGTPQRFTWHRTTDPSIPRQRPPWPGPLVWQPPHAPTLPLESSLAPRYMDVHPSIVEELAARGHEEATGSANPRPLDAHAGLVQLRIAGVLAALDGRGDINSEDWGLARQVLDCSGAVRSHELAAEASVEAAREEVASSRYARRQKEAAVASSEAVERRLIVERAEWIATKVHSQPDRWTVRSLRIACRYDRRPQFEDGLDHAKAEGWVVEVEEGGRGDQKRALRPGPKRPR